MLVHSTASADPWDDVDAILARIKPPAFPARDFDVTAYGGKADGKTDNTAAFKKAIEAANAAGGGRVTAKSGTFLTGGITLLSNVNLFVDKGADFTPELLKRMNQKFDDGDNGQRDQKELDG